MVKISTLFYVLDDTERNDEPVFDMDGLERNEEMQMISNYLDRLNLEVDHQVVDKLLKAIPGI